MSNPFEDLETLITSLSDRISVLEAIEVSNIGIVYEKITHNIPVPWSNPDNTAILCTLALPVGVYLLFGEAWVDNQEHDVIANISLSGDGVDNVNPPQAQDTVYNDNHSEAQSTLNVIGTATLTIDGTVQLIGSANPFVDTSPTEELILVGTAHLVAIQMKSVTVE